MDNKHIAEYNKKINTPGHLFRMIIGERINTLLFNKIQYKLWRLNNLRRIRDKRLKEEKNVNI